MELPRLELIQEWTKHWADLVDFEIIPVLTSAEFWARAGRGRRASARRSGSTISRRRKPSASLPARAS